MVPGKGRVNPGRTCDSCQKYSSIYLFLSPFSYDHESIRSLIHALKYQRVRTLAKVFGQLLADYSLMFKVVFPEELLVIPLPLHNRRKRIRGFNQSELISKEFIIQAGSPRGFSIDTDTLLRVKNTKPQVELSGEERRQNMADAFAVSQPDLVKNKTVLLMDDVKTTGATLEEAARALKEAGAKKVWAITVAH